VKPLPLAACLLLVGLAPSLVAQTPKPKPSAPAADGAIIDGELGETLDHMVGKEVLFGKDFAGVVLVAKGGKVLLRKGYGLMDADGKKPMRADSLWDWASVTKQFTAAAVLKLEMEKKLTISDPLKKFFPKAPADKAGVTLHQLLGHVSGIKTAPDFKGVDAFNRDQVAKYIIDLPMTSKPGEKWEYSNLGYFLLAAIIEKVSGTTYESYVKEHLFKPAGMDTACCIGDPKLDMKRVPREERGEGVQFAYGNKLSWGYRGAGGVVCSLQDMFVWDRALRGDAVLSKAAKDELYKTGLEDYSLGWWVKKENGRTKTYHSGGVGHIVTYYLRWLEDDIVVAIAWNCLPKAPPEVVANNLSVVARIGKAPPEPGR
jgi:CubicO group peptidase (beta-lactamase class C family)